MVGMPKQKYELAISLRGSENRLVWMQDKFAFFVYTGIQFIQDPRQGMVLPSVKKCFHLCELNQPNPPTDMAQRTISGDYRSHPADHYN